MAHGFRNRISKIASQVFGDESVAMASPQTDGSTTSPEGQNALQVAALARQREVLRSRGPAEDDGSGAIDRFRGYVQAYLEAIRALSASAAPWDKVIAVLDDAARARPRPSDQRGQEWRTGYMNALVDICDELSIVK